MEDFGGAVIFASIIKQLGLYVKAVFPGLMESFGLWVRAIVTLYLAIVGILVMKGTFKEATNQVITSLVLVALIQATVMETELYQKWVVETFVGTASGISGFFIDSVNTKTFVLKGEGIPGLLGQLDEMYGKISYVLAEMKPKGNLVTNAWKYIETGTALVFLMALYSVMYIAFLILLVMAYFSMYVLFAVGGICIFFASFKQTRFVFYAWLRAIINYGLLLIFTSMIMSICFFGLNTALDALTQVKSVHGLFTSQFAATLCWLAITIGLLLKAPDFAAALSGGSAGSTTGITAGLSTAAGAVITGGTYLVGNKLVRGQAARAGRWMDNRLTGGRVQRGYSKMLGLDV